MFEEFFKTIKKSNKIIIVPHKDIDLDALGAALGLYEIIDNFKIETWINIEENEYELGVKRALENVKSLNINIGKITKINVEQNDLIIIVDHHKKDMMQNPEILKLSNNVIIIDHHVISKDIITNVKYKYINSESSSTSEIVTNMIKELEIKINKKIANVLLAGITIDTNNFSIKTTANTHDSASFLNNMGADSKSVQYLLKEDLSDYISMQKIIFKTQIINSKYALASGGKTEIYEREQLSKIADSLLLFDNIEASFAIGKINSNIIGISARSLGNVDVQKIMEKLNGGGSKQYAACMMYNTTLENAKEKLINVIIGGKSESNIC